MSKRQCVEDLRMSYLQNPYGNSTQDDDKQLSEFSSRKNVLHILPSHTNFDFLLLEFLTSFNVPGKYLIFVLYDGSDDYAERVRNYLKAKHPKGPGFNFITAETTTANRKKVYQNNAINFVTPRILVADLLKNNKEVIEFIKVSGIIILNPENASEKSQIPFITRLVKDKCLPTGLYKYAHFCAVN